MTLALPRYDPGHVVQGVHARSLVHGNSLEMRIPCLDILLMRIRDLALASSAKPSVIGGIDPGKLRLPITSLWLPHVE